MSVTVDANVLVYAANESDPAHDAARELVERLAAGPGVVCLFWPVIMGYLRIVTHQGILPRPLSPDEAITNVGSLLARPHVRALGEAADFWQIYISTARGSRGNAVPDAHIAALMRQHGVRVIYTRDRDLRRYDDIEPRDPFA